MAKDVPFEANYEKAKQSIISYVGQIAQIYDIPVIVINNLVYEIALESKVSTMSMMLAGCDVEYPSTEDSSTEAENKELSDPQSKKEIHHIPLPKNNSKDPADMTNAG